MNSSSTTFLTTSRLCLRRLQPDDGPALCAYRALPEVAKYQGWDTYGPEEAERLIDSQNGANPGVPGTWFQLAFIEKETETLIGDCGLHCWKNDPRQIELGITLSPQYQRMGFATEALTGVLDFVFGRLNIHRVSAVTDAENRAAESLFLRLGFRREAHFIEHRWYKGYWDSEFVFGLLRREWTAMRASPATE